jgi:protein TonB
VQPADIDRKDRRRLASSLAVTAFFYIILFCALFAFGVLIPDGGSSPARKGAAVISLRLAAESDASSGAGTGNSIRPGVSRRAGAPVPTAHNPPAGTEHPETTSTLRSATVEPDSKLENDGESQKMESDTSGTGGTDSNGAGGGKGSGEDEGSYIGGTSGGSPAFISWLDSAIRAKLAYPEKARKRNIEGTVTILAEVSADGKNCMASVGQSSGSSILDRAAVSFVKSLFPSPVSPRKTFSGTLRIRYILTREGT